LLGGCWGLRPHAYARTRGAIGVMLLTAWATYGPNMDQPGPQRCVSVHHYPLAYPLAMGFDVRVSRKARLGGPGLVLVGPYAARPIWTISEHDGDRTRTQVVQVVHMVHIKRSYACGGCLLGKEGAGKRGPPGPTRTNPATTAGSITLPPWWNSWMCSVYVLTRPLTMWAFWCSLWLQMRYSLQRLYSGASQCGGVMTSVYISRQGCEWAGVVVNVYSLLASPSPATPEVTGGAESHFPHPYPASMSIFQQEGGGRGHPWRASTT
jgi:hypothetical protein